MSKSKLERHAQQMVPGLWLGERWACRGRAPMAAGGMRSARPRGRGGVVPDCRRRVGPLKAVGEDRPSFLPLYPEANCDEIRHCYI
jgi:hypothetical protein